MHHLRLPPLRSRRRLAELLAAALVVSLLGLVLSLTGPAEARAKQSQGLKLAVERTTPSHVYYRGKARARFEYRIAGNRARNLRIEVVRRAGGRVVKSWRRDHVRPGSLHKIRWSGTKRGGAFAGKGRYFFRVASGGGSRADRSKARGNRNLTLHSHKFPVRARHTYGDGYGAGRGHQGQDIFARCGTELQAAHSGRISAVARQSSAGNYIVISGDHTKLDYFYAHLRGSGIAVRQGQRVKAGQTLGKVGESGNASGCHLHFELWQGTWYGGGKPRSDVGRVVRRWDRWS